MDNLDEKNQDGENTEDQVLPPVDDVPAPDLINDDEQDNKPLDDNEDESNEDESVTGGLTRAERRAKAREENRK